MTRFVQTVAVALSLLWSVGVVSAATYTFTPLNYLGFRQTVAYGVNDAGHIVGIYSLPDEIVERGFYFDGSSYITLPLGACAQLQAYDINNQDEIVGACQNTSGNHGVYMDLHGFQQIIDAPGGAHGTSLLAVNTEGFLAGIYWDATDRIHGLLTDLDTWTTIDVPGTDTTVVNGLNATNTLSGQATNAGSNFILGFLTTDGVNFTLLQYPGATRTAAGKLSDSGLVVGWWWEANLGNHGFLYEGGSFTTLDYPGASATFILGISPDGSKLVGRFHDAYGVAHGFVATTQAADTTQPSITVAATPPTLWPPNGQMVAVTVTGSITDSGSGVDPASASYTVLDEYRQVQPRGNISLGPDGSYTFTVELRASRRGNDPDGRRYMIMVSARDRAGNSDIKPAIVMVTDPLRPPLLGGQKLWPLLALDEQRDRECRRCFRPVDLLSSHSTIPL